jgi:hypothetical protein
VTIETIKCSECGSADVLELKTGSYVCSHCEAVFKHVDPSKIALTAEVCRCGRLMVARCNSCSAPLCDLHIGREMPYELRDDKARLGLAAAAQQAFDTAWGDYATVRCESCRRASAEAALTEFQARPKAVLPHHYLDRAVALRTDATHSVEEQLALAVLPDNVALDELVSEFIKRARSRVPLRTERLEVGRFVGRTREIQAWWFKHARKSSYEYSWYDPTGTSGSGTGTAQLSLYLTPTGERLGPAKGQSEQHGWIRRVHPVPDDDIDVRGLFSEMATKLALPDLAY